MDLSLDIFLKIIYAMGIGVLIGIERSLIPPFTTACETNETGNTVQPEPPDTLLGVRTFSILSLGGYSAALIGTAYPSVAPVIIAGLVIMVIAMWIGYTMVTTPAPEPLEDFDFDEEEASEKKEE